MCDAAAGAGLRTSICSEKREPAADLFEQWRGLLGETDNRFMRLMDGHLAAEVAARRGRPEEALDMISDALILAREVRSRHFEGAARRVQGHIFASLRRWDEAAAAFDDAVATLEANGSRLELGRALFHRALMRQAFGDADGARAGLTRARAIFQNAGARREQERVEHALANARTGADRPA